MADTASITITATLDRIIFQKEETGFIIGQFFDAEAAGSRLTAVGTMINPQISMEYRLTGGWEDNPRFGKQFKFSQFSMIIPHDTNGIYKYIVRVCKFVAASRGQQIIDTYGKTALDVMKNEPERLSADVHGITLDRAKEIQAALLANELNESVMVELGSILDVPGIRKSLLGQLVEKYKSNAPAMVRENPYRLTQFSGVGFLLADRVAVHIGFPRDSVFRKEAAACHIIEQTMQEGSVWIHIDELLSKMKELIQVVDLDEGVRSLLKRGAIVKSADAGRYVAFSGPAEDEWYISRKLISGSFVVDNELAIGLEV
jgi:exodeoxyribonuclease V alpha subunit